MDESAVVASAKSMKDNPLLSQVSAIGFEMKLEKLEEVLLQLKRC